MSISSNKVKVAECPECEAVIRFHNPPRLGQIITCPECDEQLEVRELSPLKLDWAFDDFDEDEEEWD